MLEAVLAEDGVSLVFLDIFSSKAAATALLLPPGVSSVFFSASDSENEASLFRVIIVGIICLSSRFLSGVPELLPFLGDATSEESVPLNTTGESDADRLPLVIIISKMLLESVVFSLTSFDSLGSSVFLDSNLLSSSFSPSFSFCLSFGSLSVTVIFEFISSLFFSLELVFEMSSTSIVETSSLAFDSAHIFSVTLSFSLGTSETSTSFISRESPFLLIDKSVSSFETPSLGDDESLSLPLTLLIPIIDFIDCVPESTFTDTDFSLLAVAVSFSTALLLFAFSVKFVSLFGTLLFGKVDDTLLLTLEPLFDFPTSVFDAPLTIV